MSEQCQTQGCEKSVEQFHHRWCRDCYNKKKGDGLASPDIAKHFRVQPADIDAAMYDIGWLKRPQGGRDLTTKGNGLKRQVMDFRDGNKFVIWPPVILESRPFIAAVEKYRDKSTAQSSSRISEQSFDADAFRNKYPAEYRTDDGHYVRSRAEMSVDNFLYTAGIVHAYERKLPVEEDVYCDFYLPGGKTYIEYWGLENNPKYAARKKQKLEIYAKYNFNLIELGDDEIGNMDDYLPRLLLKFGIVVD